MTDNACLCGDANITEFWTLHWTIVLLCCRSAYELFSPDLSIQEHYSVELGQSVVKLLLVFFRFAEDTESGYTVRSSSVAIYRKWLLCTLHIPRV